MKKDTIRVAHITDLHWLSPKLPSFTEMLGKRIIGYLNLYVMGRRNYFSDSVRSQMLEHLRSQNPDVVVITGDLSSTALDDEFVAAREELRRVLGDLPVFLIPGNHDVYTPEVAEREPIREHFSSWMGPKCQIGTVRG